MRVYVAGSKIAGRGVFANKSIKKNEFIFLFKGKLVRYNYDSNYKLGSKWLGIGKNIWLDILKDCSGYYINHSCDPNAGLKGKKTIVAMKNIKKDEEVTIDYSITEDDPYWRMNCKCGNKTCRKIIRGIRFLPKNLFKKYYNFIPKFLKESYSKDHVK